MPVYELGSFTGRKIPQGMPLEARQGPGQRHRQCFVYIVARDVSFTEEPDVGNLQVRFCEGH